MATQARLEKCEGMYQAALASFNREEAAAREKYKQDLEMGMTTQDFPRWAIMSAPDANAAFAQWTAAASELQFLRESMQIAGVEDERKKHMKKSYNFQGIVAQGITDNPDIEDI